MTIPDIQRTSRQSRRVIHALRVTALVSAVSIILWLTQTAAASEDAERDLRVLQPGDNLIGWVGYQAPVQDLFDQIPQALLVYAWDAESSSYRFSTPRFQGSLREIEPGMGLIVRIDSEDPVQWRQPTVADGEWVSLKPGPNLVAWTGPSGTPIDLAVRSIGASFTQALYSNAATGELGQFLSDSRATAEPQHQLRRGDGLWVFSTTETRWLQPSGERALRALGPPPDHVRWYASFDKYLDANGIPIMATENVADEALFRAAAIFDEMLVNRPDIRDTLVRRRVPIVILGESESVFDLTPYRQYRDRIELKPFGEEGPRGVGPNDLTPTLVPEENLLCLDSDRLPGYDLTVHEYAHAVDYAVGASLRSGHFHSTLASAYRSAREAGFWEGTHAMRNVREFWASGVQAWFGLIGDRLYPRVSNRMELMHYAPSLANLIAETLGDIQVDSTCQRAEARSQGATLSHFIGGSLFDGSGAPIWDAAVRVSTASGNQLDRVSYTLTDGAFGLLAEPGNYRVEFYFDGCRVYYLEPGPTPFKPLAASLPVVDQDVILDVRLPEDLCRHRFAGSVLSARGDPLTGVTVVAQGPVATITTGTSSAGSFLFRFVDAGSYRLRFEYRGCQFVFDGEDLVRGPWPSDAFMAEQLGAKAFDLRLPEGACEATISGRILNEQGEPAVNAFVSVYQPWRSEPIQVKPDGAFDLPVDLGGEHVLLISTPACRVFYGTNGSSTDPSMVTPLRIANQHVEGLEITIPNDICGT